MPSSRRYNHWPSKLLEVIDATLTASVTCNFGQSRFCLLGSRSTLIRKPIELSGCVERAAEDSASAALKLTISSSPTRLHSCGIRAVDRWAKQHPEAVLQYRLEE